MRKNYCVLACAHTCTELDNKTNSGEKKTKTREK